MSERFLDLPAYYLLLGGLCGIVGFRLGWRSRRAWALPAVQGLLGWLAFAASWRARGAVAATIAVAGWAVFTAAASLIAFHKRPLEIDRRVLHARAYRGAMRDWLAGGGPLGGGPAATVLAHLRELALYLAAAVATANLLALVMGAVLLNSMNAWVARLLLASREPAAAGALAWPPWSVLRVAGYVMLGSVAAAPLAALAGQPGGRSELRWLAALGAAAVALDVGLKLSLSAAVGRRLAGAADLTRLEDATAPEPGNGRGGRDESRRDG